MKLQSTLSALLVPLVFGTMACLDDGISRADDTSMSRPNSDLPLLQQPLGVIGPIVTSVKSAGDLCPSGTISANEDKYSLDIGFSSEVPTGTSQTCVLEIGFNTPAGVSIKPILDYKLGANHLGEARGTLTTLYSFSGRLGRQATQPLLAADEWQDMIEVFEPAVASPCGQTSHVLRVQFTIATTSPETTLNPMHLTIGLANGSATYTSCSNGRLIPPTPLVKGASCGWAGNTAKCGPGLSCEPGLNGSSTCVSTSETAKVGDVCGGRLGIPCTDGSVCRYGRNIALANQKTSFCQAGTKGDGCNPSRPEEASCAEGLSCLNYACYTPGAAGSPCGEGYPACETSLMCSDSPGRDVPGKCYLGSTRGK